MKMSGESCYKHCPNIGYKRIFTVHYKFASRLLVNCIKYYKSSGCPYRNVEQTQLC